MAYANRITPTLALTIIVIVATIIYLNQEVPACVDNPIFKSPTVVTNFSEEVVQELDAKAQSDILVFQTEGDSMYPLIKDNQKCVCVKSENYIVNDIVVFFANFGQGFTGIAHQIISIDGEKIVTKGINNNETDHQINKNNIICKIAILPRYRLYG